MIERLKQAAVDALVFGVKWAIVLLVFGAAALLVVGDYLVVRQRAYNGQAAFEYISKQLEAQKTAQTPAVVVEPAKPAK